MSNFINLSKKLQHPTKKAWKRFRNNLQSLRYRETINKISDSIKTNTTKIRSHFNILIANWQSIHPIICTKICALTGRRPSAHSSSRRFYQYNRSFHRSMSAIYVDELFARPEYSTLACQSNNRKDNEKGTLAEASSSFSGVGVHKSEPECSRMKGVGFKKQDKIIEGNGQILGQRTFPGVDEKAEEFIAKFREDMKLQRMQSILDYQEMLARSA